MAEDETIALREALSNQFLIIKKLYTELEEEREASASGAEEALSMILRLQQEKAEEKMEACQYKRMTEAKMHHAEESLAILREVMFQKEIEIVSLNYQVQAYKQVLLSIDVHIPDIGEIKGYDNQRFSRSSASLEKTSSHSQVRRQISLPALRFDKLCSEMDIVDGDGSLLPTLQPIWKGIADYRNQLTEHQRQHLVKESVIEEYNSDLEQTHEVNTRAKKLAQAKNLEENFRSKSISANILEDMLSSSCLESESIGSTIHSVGIQDIFEVPKSHNGCILSESSRQVLQEPCLAAKHMTGMPNSMPQEAMDYCLGDDDFSKKATMYTDNGQKISTLRKGVSMNYHSAIVETEVGTGPSQTDIEQLKNRMQKFEDDIRIMKQEDLKRGKEQWKLLSEIHEQLNTMQSHIKNSKTKKPSPQDESLLVSLTEAMLSFSI